MSPEPPDYRDRFLQLAVDCGALRFGEFTLKSGRESPYFFNAGEFHHGASLAALGQCYAEAAVHSEIGFDMLFGPAYKGIPLVSAVAIALAEQGRDAGWAFDRKEVKDHGEGGKVVGAPLAGRVLIVDDVISTGISVRDAVKVIHAQGAEPAGVLVALDRQERGESERSAAAEIERSGLPVAAIAGLDDLVRWLEARSDNQGSLDALRRYQARYGVSIKS